ncbi:hypothetical protein EII12_01790 [Buchananella hordeovulneris]|nr:hypothetical protein EII12_01790 [Buchananella hordeovulneris]
MRCLSAHSRHHGYKWRQIRSPCQTQQALPPEHHRPLPADTHLTTRQPAPPLPRTPTSAPQQPVTTRASVRPAAKMRH